MKELKDNQIYWWAGLIFVVNPNYNTKIHSNLEDISGCITTKYPFNDLKLLMDKKSYQKTKLKLLKRALVNLEHIYPNEFFGGQYQKLAQLKKMYSEVNLT